MSYQIALSFEDGVTRFVKCSPNETVADASYRARINIPLDCRDGACGTCKSFCESGTFDGGDYIDEALTEDEAAAGFALPCQMRPLSDLVLQIPTTSDVAKTQAGVHASTITEIRRHSATTFGFTLNLENRESLAFLPGQYVNIAVPGTEVSRSYSFSSGPAEQDASFLIRITDQGAMSSYLRDTAQVGDKLDFTGPMGSFFLREPKRPALLLAGGTGLAPLLSILEKLTTVELEHPVHLIYGVSTDMDLVELDKLEHYASVIDRFTFDYCVADQASSAPNKGYVTGLIRQEHVNDGDVDVYLCGPPAMVEAVRQWLKTEDITPTNFYYEKFALAVRAEPEPAAAEPAEAAAAPAEAAVEPAEAAPSGTYEIGEEHVSLADSDAQFDARMALELGAVELTMGRLTPEQLTEYRILAELSSATISADRFLDAAAFTDTNAAFHEYLFNCTGNEFLLQAYQRLDVKNYMTRVLRTGQWVDESVPSDHLDLVQAFEHGDLSAARNIVVSHAARAKATMRSSIEQSHSG